MARTWSAPEEALNRLFRRCLECPTNAQPACPKCPTGQFCSLQPQTCNSCPAMVCLNMDGIPGQETSKKSFPVGGIIGAAVGGVVIVLGITFLVWRFCGRRKKRQVEWVPPEKSEAERPITTLSRTHSIASTVMTQASNVIQIAYIPGVTVRSAPVSPEIPPPMPSIPAAYTGTSAQTTPELEQHFFMPKDLRDSVWSDTSSMMTDPRISIAPSLARTTMYQENAEVPPIPAQYAYVGQANAVSVRSGSSTPSLAQNSSPAPPMPKAINISASSIVARNVVARPIEVKKSASTSSGQSLGANLVKKSASRRATPVPVISDEKEVVMSSPSSTIMSDSPLLSGSTQVAQSSFISMEGVSVSGLPAVSPAEGPLGSGSTPSGRPTTAYAEAMIHEAMLRAVQDTSHSIPQRSEPKNHDSGPFGDANEIR